MATTTTIRRPARGARYEEDFAAWAEAQAAALRAGRLDELDLERLAEEVADLSNRERDAIGSHLETLVIHLLKWRYDPEHRSRSWEATVRVARRHIAKLLRRSPSLRREVPALLEEAYPNARDRAAAETGLPEETFPEACPFKLDQITGEGMPDA